MYFKILSGAAAIDEAQVTTQLLLYMTCVGATKGVIRLIPMFNDSLSSTGCIICWIVVKIAYLGCNLLLWCYYIIKVLFKRAWPLWNKPKAISYPLLCRWNFILILGTDDIDCTLCRRVDLLFFKCLLDIYVKFITALSFYIIYYPPSLQHPNNPLAAPP